MTNAPVRTDEPMDCAPSAGRRRGRLLPIGALGAVFHLACGPLGGEGTATPGQGNVSSAGSTADDERPAFELNAELEGMTLRDAADTSGHLIGIALSARRLAEPEYAETARAEFNYVTAENEMKWQFLQPQPGVFDFERADEIMSFAEANGMLVKGHTLVWHSQLPDWVAALTTPDEVRSAMLTHIETVVGRYRGRVQAWDVVNEAWQDNGRDLRDTVFRTQLGDGYIDEAFHAARAADPDAKLYYNDYGGEGTSAKANAIFTMVQGMLERGVPIDGVGLQMHTRSGSSASPSVAEVRINIRRLAALGLEVSLTELDVASCDARSLELRMDDQRTRYYELVSACVGEPGCNAVTIWGLIDRYSWLNNNNQGLGGFGSCGGQAPLPLLFDDAYEKKPAYAGVLEALLGR